ncbi:metallophosphoesterase [Erwiniaceae bacterium BAC15a-03b]|uniref:Metallophosphoesterase n=1 Tax=Winslowiella arboricola TaxID=2978220 RepID=A0A9J6PQN0_9GAMM|nr:metallophosphoesterase [Winslowiella arboricola]MCU5772452.1 metallophosphoesterase [Winslowiella arboricola]MCU5779754.1 metallophosphoesterase [Winslowiella arboricola]
MFHLIFSLPSWYAIVRFIGPLPWPPAVKVVISLLMLLSSQYLLFSKFSSGSAMSPEMPRIVIILFNWAFSAVLFIAISQLLLDVVMLIAMLLQHPLEIVPFVRYVAGIAALLLAAFGVYQAIRVPPVKDIIIEVKNLSHQFEGYQLLQLTDLHISKLFNRLWTTRLVKQANALSVDLIVITGDVIDGTLANRKGDVDPLRGLRAPDGVFAITGNHEYFFEQQAWTEHLDSLGMKPLINSHTVIERRGESLVLAGVTDMSAPRSGFPGPDLGKALAGAPQDAAVMLLDHYLKTKKLVDSLLSVKRLLMFFTEQLPSNTLRSYAGAAFSPPVTMMCTRARRQSAWPAAGWH